MLFHMSSLTSAKTNPNENHTPLNVLNVKWVQPCEGALSAVYNRSSHREASAIKEKKQVLEVSS